jgi:hypothetical protein
MSDDVTKATEGLEAARAAHEAAQKRLQDGREAVGTADAAVVTANERLAQNPHDNAVRKTRRAAVDAAEEARAIIAPLANAVTATLTQVREAEAALKDAQAVEAARVRGAAIDEAAGLVRERAVLESQIAALNVKITAILDQHHQGDAVAFSNEIRRRAGQPEIDQLGRPFLRAV